MSFVEIFTIPNQSQFNTLSGNSKTKFTIKCPFCDQFVEDNLMNSHVRTHDPNQYVLYHRTAEISSLVELDEKGEYIGSDGQQVKCPLCDTQCELIDFHFKIRHTPQLLQFRQMMQYQQQLRIEIEKYEERERRRKEREEIMKKLEEERIIREEEEKKKQIEEQLRLIEEQKRKEEEEKIRKVEQIYMERIIMRINDADEEQDLISQEMRDYIEAESEKRRLEEIKVWKLKEEEETEQMLKEEKDEEFEIINKLREENKKRKKEIINRFRSQKSERNERFMMLRQDKQSELVQFTQFQIETADEDEEEESDEDIKFEKKLIEAQELFKQKKEELRIMELNQRLIEEERKQREKEQRLLKESKERRIKEVELRYKQIKKGENKKQKQITPRSLYQKLFSSASYDFPFNTTWKKSDCMIWPREKLSHGNTDTVQHVIEIKTRNHVCWKEMNFYTDKEKLNFAKEVKIATDVYGIVLQSTPANQFIHIVEPLGCFIDEDEHKAYLVMELCANGNLRKFIADAKETGNFVSPKSANKLVFQVAESLNQLHVNGILHMDLKPESILLDENFKVKLTNFSRARQLHLQLEFSIAYGGTFLYRAPEILQIKNMWNPDNNEKDDDQMKVVWETLTHMTAVDIWSFGVMFFELLAQRHPFFDDQDEYYISPLEIIQRVVDDTPAELPDFYPQQLKDLIKQMLIKDPAHRITAEQILATPILTLRKKQAIEKQQELANTQKEVTEGKKLSEQ